MERESVFARHNATACFPDMVAAREAIGSLEQAGVAGSAISLLGPSAEAAANADDTTRQDEAMLQEGMKATLGGAVAGTGLGAAAGFMAGLVAFGIPGVGPAIGAGVWALTIGGAVAGGGVGFTAGAMAKMKQSQAWELTLGDVGEGWVVVGLHTDAQQEFDRGVAVLQEHAPARLRRFDADGHELPAA